MSSIKTVAYPFPQLASLTDASLTAFTQITVELPESSKVFKRCWVDAMATDLITATGGTVTESRLALSVAGAAATTITNLNDIGNSGEQMAPYISAEFTAQFTSNFTGTSHTVDLSIYLDQSTGTTFNFVDVTAILYITYEFDETSTTQIMTAFIPFDSPAAAMATAKPGTANETIPAFDTFFPNAASYKSIFLIAEGNEAVAGATTAHVLNVQVDTLTAYASSSHTQTLASDRYVRHLINWMSGGSPIFTTNATHSLYWWSSVARNNHFVFTAIVTYTFDATGTARHNTSLMMPMVMDSPMGGTTSSDSQRGKKDFWIAEPGTITLQKSACRLYFSAIAAVAGLNFRVGTQSYRGYTHNVAAACGDSALQRTCDDGISIARGKNTLVADLYRTDTTDLGWSTSCIWIINYLSDKPTGGYYKANHTVFWNLKNRSTTAAAQLNDISATAPTIPETDYFMSAVGLHIYGVTNGTATLYSLAAFVERLSAEGGPTWEPVYLDAVHTDPETGLRQFTSQARDFFNRYPGDVDSNRFDIETNRRWRFVGGNAVAFYWTVNLLYTYHSITKTIGGNISGSAGGTVTINLIRKSDGQKMKTTSRVGNGAYSFSWYDDVETMFVEAREDATHKSRSDDGVGA